MKKNIGTSDRILRLTIALIFFGLALWQKSWILALVGLFTLYEAAASWCVLYQLIGKNTCPINDKTKK
ncbi:MAG: hypothetical protein BGO14_02890 [Chlamydiales bacterium 38-26]|nr:MAG: hypothetical protein BGO14_02890 [Chlamydiales bacterium 38-26]